MEKVGRGKNLSLSRWIGIRRGLSFCFFLSLVIGIGWVRLWSWAEIEQKLSQGPACPLRSWTGLRCAFCGMTHSWIAIWRGEWAMAWEQNPFGFATLAMAMVVSVRAWTRPEASAVTPKQVTVILWVLIWFAIVRNFGWS